MYTWFNLFYLPDFLSSGLISRTLRVNLETLGQKDILITHGNEVGVIYDGNFLVVKMGGDNPFIRDDYAVFLDSDQNVWFGIESS